MYNEWLENEKHLTHKVAGDVRARLNRVKNLLGCDEVPADALSQLESNSQFNALTTCVKSQLRRATRLYLEYKENN